MKIRIIAVGRLKEKFYSEAVDESKKRLSKFCEVEIIEIADEKAPEKLSAAELCGIKDAEGRRILEKIAVSDTVIAAELRGKMLSSVEFAEKLQGFMLDGRSRITFIIGGSNGLSADVLARADFKWCFSPLTFSHQIFRIMLMEQIYRAFKIINGEPYHK